MSDPAEQENPFPTTSPASYEFTGAQNEVIRNLETKMRVLGIVFAFYGLVLCVPAFRMDFFNLIWGLIWVAIGTFTYRAANGFRLIADTSGKDLSHLMEALKDLTNLFQIVLILVLLGIGSLMAYLIYFLLVQAAAP